MTFFENTSRDEKNEEWMWSNGPISVGAGLQNLGNTCFMNSVLQCMTYTPPLANFCQKGRHKAFCQLTEFCVMCDFEAHVQKALSSSGQTVVPHSFANNLSRICQDFQLGFQEDAHEYMCRFLDALQKSCPPINLGRESSDINMSLCRKIFGGYLRSRMKCTICTHGSDTIDPFLDLSLDILKAGSLDRALACFTGVEILDGEERYYCENCQKRVRALKRLTIHKAPLILMIQLKRFNSVAEKLGKKIDFKEILDIKSFTSHGDSIRYRLYAVLVHSGKSAHRGHYFCYIQTSAETWHLLDDSIVKQVDEQTVFGQEAYLLFYCLESIFPSVHCKESKNVQTSREPICHQRSSQLERNGHSQTLQKSVETVNPKSHRVPGSSMEISEPPDPASEERQVHQSLGSPCSMEELTPMATQTKRGFDRNILSTRQNLKVGYSAIQKSTNVVRAGSTAEESSSSEFTLEAEPTCWKLLNSMPRNQRLLLASSLPTVRHETFETSKSGHQVVDLGDKRRGAKLSNKRKL